MKDASPNSMQDKTPVSHLLSKKEKEKVTSNTQAAVAVGSPRLITLSNIIATKIVAKVIAYFAP